MVKKCLAWYLVVAMFVIGIAPRVEAAFSPSEILPLIAGDRASDMERIQKVLEMKLVQQRLQDLGYTAEEIGNRLSQLGDQQIHRLAQKLDDLKVGQDGTGVIIFLLVVIVVILIVLQATGRRVIVTQ
jgi:hypothetical protein